MSHHPGFQASTTKTTPTDTDRARELGAEHGKRDAEALDIDPVQRSQYLRSLLDGEQEWHNFSWLPEPDLHTARLYDVLMPKEQDAYRVAYREARDATIREAVQS